MNNESPLIVAEPRGSYRRLPPVVVDCSVLAAVLFDEPQRDNAALALSGKELFAPWLIDHEMVSVAVKKASAGFADVAEEGLADYSTLKLTRCAIDPAAQWQLAREHELTACDAAYLQLAVDMGAPLVTFDAGLGSVARVVLEG